MQDRHCFFLGFVVACSSVDLGHCNNNRSHPIQTTPNCRSGLPRLRNPQIYCLQMLSKEANQASLIDRADICGVWENSREIQVPVGNGSPPGGLTPFSVPGVMRVRVVSVVGFGRGPIARGGAGAEEWVEAQPERASDEEPLACKQLPWGRNPETTHLERSVGGSLLSHRLARSRRCLHQRGWRRCGERRSP